MARHRSHRIAFRRQVVREYLSGETLPGLAKRHDLAHNLGRVWLQEYEAFALDDDAAAADTIQDYDTRIAALERLVGRQPLELEFIKVALPSVPLPSSGRASVITDPIIPPFEQAFAEVKALLRTAAARTAAELTIALDAAFVDVRPNE